MIYYFEGAKYQTLYNGQKVLMSFDPFGSVKLFEEM